tara:strand:+ start:479 stop:2353 length:1875 start_codon:yes stop_codon:yes gene_type:complete
MAKVITDITLKDGTDEAAFITDVTSNSEVDLKNRMPNTPTIVVLKVEESYLDTLRSHSSVLNVEVPPPTKSIVTYPSIPSKYTVTGRRVTGYEFPSDRASVDGRTCLSLQHYYDSDLMVTDDYIGMMGTDGQADKDDHYRLTNQTYSSNYTGKHVDIIIHESGDTEASENGSESHPDFDDPDNTGTSRCIKMNWPDLESTHNNQVTNGNMWNYHGLKSASVAAGLVGGLAKKAKIRTVYSSTEDTAIEIYDAIKGWHNAKGNNPSTGIPDPTIVVIEWSYFSTNHEYAIKCEDIDSITYPGMTTANQPGGGWGSDLTPFVDRNMIPFQMNDPTDSSWHWVITFPRQDQYSSLKTAVDGAVDAGVVFVTSYGNEGVLGCKEGQSEYNGAYCTTSGTTTKYSLDPTGTNLAITKTTTTDTTHYKFRDYGTGGLDKTITSAAGQNSEKHPTLDSYSGRGPGIDVIGRGVYTFCAGRNSDSVYQDGNKWGTFGGNSCGNPTTAGRAAVHMEKYYVLNGVWPTPAQVKDMLKRESRHDVEYYSSVPNWASVPAASDTDIIPTQQIYTSTGHVKLKHGEPQDIHLTDKAGTTAGHVFWNAKGFNRENTYKKRPLEGVLYPRPRKFDIPRS